jgi:ABC-type branched-subunit amino acid transport system substrate-binding protein
LAVLIPTAEEWPEFTGALGAVSLAVKAANDRFSIVNAATRLEVHLRETECDYSKSVATLSRIMEEFPVDGIIGPHCSKACASTADLANGRDIPQISYSCASAELSDKTRYPTFVRVVSSLNSRVRAIIAFAQWAKWVQLSVVSSTSIVYADIVPELERAMQVCHRMGPDQK